MLADGFTLAVAVAAARLFRLINVRCRNNANIVAQAP
jgi:hypothetical protein